MDNTRASRTSAGPEMAGASLYCRWSQHLSHRKRPDTATTRVLRSFISRGADCATAQVALARALIELLWLSFFAALRSFACHSSLRSEALPVILSAAKNPHDADERFFAA